MQTEQRLARLERECRKWRLAAVTMAVLLTTLVSMAQMKAKQQVVVPLLEAPDSVVSARSITVWNGPGTQKITLDGDGLQFRDREDRLRLVATISEHDEPTAVFFDKAGRKRLSLQVNRYEAVELDARDARGFDRVSIFTNTQGDASMSINDPEQRLRVRMRVSKEGYPRVAVLNHKGIEIASMP